MQMDQSVEEAARSLGATCLTFSNTSLILFSSSVSATTANGK
ncbi:hypothetical protein [Cytobacillus solani]|nr:hypothetical protein [Cytobacillus solani]